MRSHVRAIVERKGVEADVTEVIVRTAEEAAALRFPGSPTVMVNGGDVEPEAEMKEDYGVG